MNKKLANLFLAISALLETESSRTIVVGPFGLPEGLEDAIKAASKGQNAKPELAAAAGQEAPAQGAPEQAWEELESDDIETEIDSDWQWQLKEGYHHNRVNGVRPERAWRTVEDRHIGKTPADFSKAEFRRPV